MPACKKCGGSKRIVAGYDDHTDNDPCEDCIGPVNGCAKGHPSITFHGRISDCPLCALRQAQDREIAALRQELAIAADAAAIARTVRDALEAKLGSL